MTRSVSPSPARSRPPGSERRLEGAGRGGADGDDASALRPRAVDRGRRGLGDGESLGVDAVLAHVLGLDRPERAGAHVQDELGALDAALAQALEESGGEVEAGGRGGHGARLAGVDRLVPIPVRGRVRAADVGRQGHVAVPLEGRLGVEAVEEKADAAQGRRRVAGRGRPRLGALDPDAQARPDVDDDPRPQASAGAHHGLPEVRLEAPHEQDLGLATARPAAEEAGGKDAAAVRDEKVAGAEELREIGKGAVLEGAGRALEHEQPRGVPRGERLLRDELRRQLEVVRADLVVGAGLGHGLRRASSGGWPRARCRARAGRGARRRGAWPCAPGGCGRGSRAGGGTARRCPRSRRAPR